MARVGERRQPSDALRDHDIAEVAPEARELQSQRSLQQLRLHARLVAVRRLGVEDPAFLLAFALREVEVDGRGLERVLVAREQLELVLGALPRRPDDAHRSARPEVLLLALARFASSSRLLALAALLSREVEAQPALDAQPGERRPLDVAVEAAEVPLVVDPPLL